MILRGWKTYLSAAALIIAGVAYAFGWITIEHLIAVQAIANGGGFIGLRAAKGNNPPPNYPDKPPGAV